MLVHYTFLVLGIVAEGGKANTHLLRRIRVLLAQAAETILVNKYLVILMDAAHREDTMNPAAQQTCGCSGQLHSKL